VDRRRRLRDDGITAAVRDLHAPAGRVVFFETVERRFGRQARVTTVLAGLSGFYMVVRLGLWDRFLSVEYLWMHAVVAVWLLFTLMLFVAEPLFLHRWLRARANSRPESTFRLIERMQWILLVLSLITLIGAVLGSHGMLIIGALDLPPGLPGDVCVFSYLSGSR
jgi:hypothetical protein